MSFYLQYCLSLVSLRDAEEEHVYCKVKAFQKAKPNSNESGI